MGWKAIRVIGARCDVRVWRAGARGRKGPDDDEAVERDDVDSSDNKDALRDSRSMIYIFSSSSRSGLFDLSGEEGVYLLL